MKLIYAIVNNDDTYAVSKGLSEAGIRATKLATTGGFLMKGNTTYMICCDAEMVDKVIDICRNYCKKRKQTVSAASVMGGAADPSSTMEITIGGATIFVTDIERFEQV